MRRCWRRRRRRSCCALRGCGTGKAVISLATGLEDPEKVAVAFLVAVGAAEVGPGGQVAGVDMTAEMLSKSRRTAEALGLAHVEFRDGLAEALPVEDSWADVVISNGVINLCADKQAVFAEILRVLRPGGRLQFADIANGCPVPAEEDGQIPGVSTTAYMRTGARRPVWMAEGAAVVARQCGIRPRRGGCGSQPSPGSSVSCKYCDQPRRWAGASAKTAGPSSFTAAGRLTWPGFGRSAPVA